MSIVRYPVSAGGAASAAQLAALVTADGASGGFLKDSDASANGRSLIAAANYAAMRGLLDLEGGTDFLTPAAIAAAYRATFANGQLPGTATNDEATAGNVGEVIGSNIPSGSAVSLTTGAAKTVTSITLSPGDWQISGGLIFVPAGVPTWISVEWSLTDNAQDQSAPHGGRHSLKQTLPSAQNQVLPLGVERLLLASEDIVYLVAYAEFASTMTTYGFISARRMR